MKTELEKVGTVEGRNVHSTISPLSFLHNVQTGMDDELVHVLSCVRKAKPRNAIAATF
jgi:hypothetical protein